MKKLSVLALSVLVLSSCAHHRDVRPSADGINHVVVRAPTRESAERSAISQADHYCDQFDKHAGFVEENKTQYTGSMDENTRETVRKASKAAQILGGAGTVAGRGDTRTGGEVLGTAGVIGGVMTSGNDYLADMRFKCQ